jgi:hypothetical protein
MFEKSRRPPEPGSPMEMVYLLVWKMRQDIEFHKSRATLQALLSQKGAEDKTIMEAFAALKEAFFPFDRNQKKDEMRQLKEAMVREVARGALSVTPLHDPNRKKIASRLVRGNNDLAQRQSMNETGRVTPIDAFDRARSRPRGAS